VGNINVDLSDLNKLSISTDNILQDTKVRVAINNFIAKVLDPYVPMDTGQLSKTVKVLPKSLVYSAKGKPSVQCPDGDYAHYIYEGTVYASNIPIIQNGVLIGWYSPKGEAKHKTSRLMKYHTPLGRSHWDLALVDNPNEMEKINIFARKFIESKIRTKF